jgi:hypothetical protein
MPIGALIERIIGKQRDRKASRSADFRSLVSQIADGQEPHADFVAQVLQDAGKSLDDLRKAVEMLEKRREWRKQVDRGPALAAERREIEQQMLAADEILDDAEQRHAETTNPLRTRHLQIGEELTEIDRIKRELANTCADEDLLAKVATIVTKRSDAHRQASEHRDAARTGRERANGQRDAAERAKQARSGHSQVDAYLDKAKEHDREEAEALSKAAKAEKTIAALEREETALREQMLVP